MAEGDPEGSGRSNPPPNMPGEDPRSSVRVFKKTSLNNKITLYVACRDVVLQSTGVQKVEGVLLIDPEYAKDKTISGRIILIFRYGREDEEIMGLQFCNESSINKVKIWPTSQPNFFKVTLSSPLQETLVRKLGPNAIPFHMEVSKKSQPSVLLVPTKPYIGQPVGTSYDIRVFMGDDVDDVSQPILRMGIRVTHGASRIDTAPLLTPSPSKESFRVKPRYQRFKKMFTSVVLRRPRARIVEEPADPVTEDESGNSLHAQRSHIKSRLKDLKARTKTRAQNENEIENGENIENGDQENNQRNAVNKYREKINDMERSENEGDRKGAEERSDNNEDIQENEDSSIESDSAVPVAPRPAPRVEVEKSFLLSDGKLHLESWLDKSSYHHGERLTVNFRIVNNSRKTVHRIKAFAIQYVDVCMFDNGKFKNKVAMAKDSCYSVPPGQRCHDYYTMRPRRVMTKNWIALEPTVNYPEGCLASTVVCESEDGKSQGISSIFISYYVKLTLFMNRLGGRLSVKLPFSLSHAPLNESPADSLTTGSGNRTYVVEGKSSGEDNEVDEEKNNKDDEREEDDRNKIDIEQDDNVEVDGVKDNNQEGVSDGNAPIGNQVSNSEVDIERRQSVPADVSVNIIENQPGDGSHFEELPLVRAPKPDEEYPIVRYLETNI